jgi:hypothetical protein
MNVPFVLGIAYADDLASFGNDPESVQPTLGLLENPMMLFNLGVNAGKTQVLVFIPPTQGDVFLRYSIQPHEVNIEWSNFGKCG